MATNESKRAFGLFSTKQQTEAALHQLKAAGFPMENVSVLAKQIEGDQQLEGAIASDRIEGQKVNTSTGVVQDTLAYSTWGSILVGLTSLAIPGIGPIIAAGSLGVSLVAMTGSTAVATVATGNLVKALTHLGISEAEAKTYSDRLLQGNYLVVLEGSDSAIQQAETAFNEQKVQAWNVYSASPA